MLTYLSALLPDTSWPFWPHFWLLSVSILASFAVGAGIIFEGSKYSDATHRVATWLVIGGIAIESLCTFCLFIFDEGISSAQQSKIIQLESRRQLSQSQKSRIAAVTAKFPSIDFVAVTVPDAEPWNFVMEIAATLKTNGWIWHPCANPDQTGLRAMDDRPSECTSILGHIEIDAPPDLLPAAYALADAIREPEVIGMDDVRVDPNIKPNAMTIMVGSKR